MDEFRFQTDAKEIVYKIDEIKKANVPESIKPITKQITKDYENALISTASVKGNLVDILKQEKHSDDDIFYDRSLHRPLVEIGRFRRLFVEAMQRSDRLTAIQCLYNIVGRLPEELKFDFDDLFYHDLNKRYPSMKMLRDMMIKVENAITKYTEFLINDSYHKEVARKKKMTMSLMEKRKRFAEVMKQKHLSKFGQEPIKPKRLCRYGHPIIVSTCKFHHREGKIDERAKMEKRLLKIIERLKKEKMEYESKKPKHWLKEAYTRFFWLDYKERIIIG